MVKLASPTSRPVPLREYRCYCGWLLFKARLAPGSSVQVKCRGCREIVTVVSDVDASRDTT